LAPLENFFGRLRVAQTELKQSRPVFAREVRDGARSAELVVNKIPTEGWDMRESRDGRGVHETTYQNWHRVELEMRRFSAEAAQLKRHVWRDAGE